MWSGICATLSILEYDMKKATTHKDLLVLSARMQAQAQALQLVVESYPTTPELREKTARCAALAAEIRETISEMQP